MRVQCDQCLLTPLVRLGGNYICDLPWKIDPQASQILIQRGGNVVQQSFRLEEIRNAFVRTVAEIGVPVVVPKAPTFLNLCKEHWALALGADYAGIPAKTRENGIICLRNGHKEFNPDDTPDLDKIRSTCVHEMMHAWSSSHTGLQWRHGMGQFEIDECVADLLGRKVYFKSQTGPTYKTGYGKMSEFVASQFGPAFSKVLPGFQLDEARDDVRQTRLQQAFANLDHGHLNPAHRNLFYWELSRWLLTWFLKGRNMPVHGHNADWFFGTRLYKLFFSGTTSENLGYSTPRQFSTAALAEFAAPPARGVAA